MALDRKFGFKVGELACRRVRLYRSARHLRANTAANVDTGMPPQGTNMQKGHEYPKKDMNIQKNNRRSSP